MGTVTEAFEMAESLTRQMLLSGEYVQPATRREIVSDELDILGHATHHRLGGGTAVAVFSDK